MHQYDQTTIDILKTAYRRLETAPSASINLLTQLQAVIELAEVELDLSDD